MSVTEAAAANPKKGNKGKKNPAQVLSTLFSGGGVASSSCSTDTQAPTPQSNDGAQLQSTPPTSTENDADDGQNKDQKVAALRSVGRNKKPIDNISKAHAIARLSSRKSNDMVRMTLERNNHSLATKVSQQRMEISRIQNQMLELRATHQQEVHQLSMENDRLVEENCRYKALVDQVPRLLEDTILSGVTEFRRQFVPFSIEHLNDTTSHENERIGARSAPSLKFRQAAELHEAKKAERLGLAPDDGQIDEVDEDGDTITFRHPININVQPPTDNDNTPPLRPSPTKRRRNERNDRSRLSLQEELKLDEEEDVEAESVDVLEKIDNVAPHLDSSADDTSSTSGSSDSSTEVVQETPTNSAELDSSAGKSSIAGHVDQQFDSTFTKEAEDEGDGGIKEEDRQQENKQPVENADHADHSHVDQPSQSVSVVAVESAIGYENDEESVHSLQLQQQQQKDEEDTAEFDLKPSRSKTFRRRISSNNEEEEENEGIVANADTPSPKRRRRETFVVKPSSLATSSPLESAVIQATPDRSPGHFSAPLQHSKIPKPTCSPSIRRKEPMRMPVALPTSSQYKKTKSSLATIQQSPSEVPVGNNKPEVAPSSSESPNANAPAAPVYNGSRATPFSDVKSPVDNSPFALTKSPLGAANSSPSAAAVKNRTAVKPLRKTPDKTKTKKAAATTASKSRSKAAKPPKPKPPTKGGNGGSADAVSNKKVPAKKVDSTIKERTQSANESFSPLIVDNGAPCFHLSRDVRLSSVDSTDSEEGRRSSSRRAALKVTSFKEASLNRKMRRPE